MKEPENPPQEWLVREVADFVAEVGDAAVVARDRLAVDDVGAERSRAKDC